MGDVLPKGGRPRTPYDEYVEADASVRLFDALSNAI